MLTLELEGYEKSKVVLATCIRSHVEDVTVDVAVA